MKSERQEKMSREIIKIASEFVNRETNRTSLLTIMRCDISPDFKNATLYISVLPSNKEAAGIAFLNRHLHDLRNFIKRSMNMRIVPFFSVEIDMGEKNRQKIDDLSRGV